MELDPEPSRRFPAFAALRAVCLSLFRRHVAVASLHRKTFRFLSHCQIIRLYIPVLAFYQMSVLSQTWACLNLT